MRERKTEHLPRARAVHSMWIRAWTEITRGKRDGKHGRIRHARPPRHDQLIFCPFPISVLDIGTLIKEKNSLEEYV